MKFRYILYSLFLVLFSCTDDQTGILPEPGTEGELSFTFHLNIPGLTEVSTRAMADNEYTIREIDIVVFHDEVFYRLASGRDLVRTNSGYSFEASLLPTDKKVQLYFIANISATLHENFSRIEELVEQGIIVTPALAKTLGFVRYENFISRRDVFPMSGELILENGLEDNTAIPEIKMMRAFARVDVIAHDNVTSRFQLEKATVYRMNDLFRIAPDDGKFESDPNGNYITANEPSVPEDAQKELTSQAYSASGSKITHMYLPESEACDPVTEQPTCLIIQGKYQGNSTPSYYRVDLGPKDSPGEVIRNYKYTLTITSVTGPGKSTIDEALLEPSEDINTYIIWEEDGSNTIYDKDGKYIQTDKRTFSLHFAKAAMDMVHIETNLTDTYTLEWADENGDPIGSTRIRPGESMSDAEFKVRISADGKTIYTTALKENEGTTHKTRKLLGRVKNILFTMTIDQGTRAERTYVKLYNPLGLRGDLGDEVMNAVSSGPIAGSLLRDLIRNEEWFGFNGIVAFDGFKISGQNYELPITNYLLRMFDVVLIGDGSVDRTDATTTSFVTQWLQDTSDHKKVLVVYTSNTNLVQALGTTTVSTYDLSYRISEDATDTFLKGPFGEVTANSTISTSYSTYYNFMSRTANSHLTPLLTDASGNNIVIAADLNKKVLYMSDYSMFNDSSGLLTGNGKIETDLDRLFANIWAWIAETVLGDVYDPEVAR
ncbi:MAG: Mfa1 fimbrilin C-terminal domain-containing protein [Bacteroides sp.]|nr:Mfa1 fimbrilin C-terminal domain-containing protein [Bacteroides sp.]